MEDFPLVTVGETTQELEHENLKERKRVLYTCGATFSTAGWQALGRPPTFEVINIRPLMICDSVCLRATVHTFGLPHTLATQNDGVPPRVKPLMDNFKAGMCSFDLSNRLRSISSC